jgi:hypothetical protein
MAELLEHCLSTSPDGNDSDGRFGIAVARAKFKAWTRRNDIEDDIIHLKDQVEACRSRFQVCILNLLQYDDLEVMIPTCNLRQTLATARIEHSLIVLRADVGLLVLNNEQQVRLTRMESNVVRRFGANQGDVSGGGERNSKVKVSFVHLPLTSIRC